MILKSRWYLLVCCLINFRLVKISATKLNGTLNACPDNSLCTCKDEYIEGYGTQVEVNCKSMKLKSMPDLSSFSGVVLHKLDLSENDMSVLNDDDFAGIQMKSVYPHTTADVILDKNPLIKISPHTFRGLQTDGLGIRLSNCGLKNLPSDAFRNVDKLVNLHLDNNKIALVPDYYFAGFNSLEYLDLSGNPLETLNPDTFGGLEKTLQGVYLKNVGLESFPAHALKRLRNLETVNLNNNEITSIPDFVLDGFETTNNGFILYLKNNGIRHVSPQAFLRSGTRLEVKGLHLEENLIGKVPFLSNPCDLIFSSVADIWMENNPLHCDCDLYSATYTGFYRFEGTCAGPGDYKGVRVDVVRTKTTPPRPSYEGGFGTLARSDCGDNNITRWDMRCIERHAGMQGHAASVECGAVMTLTLCISVLLLTPPGHAHET